MRFYLFITSLLLWFIFEGGIVGLAVHILALSPSPTLLFAARALVGTVLLGAIFWGLKVKDTETFRAIFTWPGKDRALSKRYKTGFLFFGIYLLVLAFLSFLQQQGFLIEPDFILQIRENKPPFWLSFYAVVIVGVALEEIFFRGWLYHLLEKQGWNLHRIVWVSSLLFCALHLQYDYTILLAIFPLSLVLGYARAYSGSLLLPLLLHALHNGLTMLAIYTDFSYIP